MESNKKLNDLIINLKPKVIRFTGEKFPNELWNSGFQIKKIRPDIIEAAISNHTGDNFLFLYKKCKTMNNNISKDIINSSKPLIIFGESFLNLKFGLFYI